jgi:uncharacterized protein YqeY
MLMLERIDEDLKQAMLDKDITKVSVLRMVKSALQNQTIENKGTLTEDDAVIVLQREVKKRKEAAQMYQQNDNEVRSQTELAEAEIIQDYLPEQMSEDELKSIINDTVGSLQTDNMGQIMGAVMQKVQGKADGGTVSRLVKERLAQ